MIRWRCYHEWGQGTGGRGKTLAYPYARNMAAARLKELSERFGDSLIGSIIAVSYERYVHWWLVQRNERTGMLYLSAIGGRAESVEGKT